MDDMLFSPRSLPSPSAALPSAFIMLLDTTFLVVWTLLHDMVSFVDTRCALSTCCTLRSKTVLIISPGRRNRGSLVFGCFPSHQLAPVPASRHSYCHITVIAQQVAISSRGFPSREVHVAVRRLCFRSLRNFTPNTV